MRWISVVIVGCIFAASACSSNKGQLRTDTEIYPQRELGKFLKETTPSNQVLNEYIIGVGDRLDIVFFFHENLTTENLLVRSDGRITLPYVGDVMAAGNTPMHLDTLLTNRFADILRDPNVSVIVRETPEQTVYVLGQVANPGGYPFERSVSLLQALALAGGLDKGAKSDHVLVIRREGLDKIVGVEMNVKFMLKGLAVGNDFLLRNYDIVYVPKTRIKTMAEFAESLNEVLLPPVDLLLRGWQAEILRRQLQELQKDN